MATFLQSVIFLSDRLTTPVSSTFVAVLQRPRALRFANSPLYSVCFRIAMTLHDIAQDEMRLFLAHRSCRSEHIGKPFAPAVAKTGDRVAGRALWTANRGVGKPADAVAEVLECDFWLTTSSVGFARYPASNRHKALLSSRTGSEYRSGVEDKS